MFCVLDIYKRNLDVVYKTTICSKATFFVLFSSLIGIIVPFILAYRSRGFWLKRDTFYEQPNVRFRGEYFFMGLTNNISDVIICNNIYNFPQLQSFDKCSKLKVREIDNNYDGKPDSLHFQMEVTNDYHHQKENFNNLQHMTLILPLDYRLQTMCPLRMQSAIILQHTIIQRTTSITVTANLYLKQKAPLFCYPKITDKTFNYLFPIQNKNSLDNFKIDNIISNYIQRNISTHLTETYITYDFKPGNLQLKLMLDYPEQAIYYRPGFWQIIKWAWIQYLAIFVVLAWLISKFQKYVFENDLVLVYKALPNAMFHRLVNKKKFY